MSEFYDYDSYDCVDFIKINNIKKKYSGKKLGFTCSSFDLLHCGHTLMLKDAKDQCDILIVGLQTDPTIDRKTKNKPIQSFEEREIMISSIKYVNEVITYSTESQLLDIISYLNPNVRILGTDWKGKKYTGFNLPIDIHWHNRDHDWSTSNLRRRVYEAELKKNLK
jgi:glycerol-3-phosphate cytidylyltransferase